MVNRHVELVNSCTFTRFSKFLIMEIEQNLFYMLLILYLDRRCLKISQFFLNRKRAKTARKNGTHVLLISSGIALAKFLFSGVLKLSGLE